MSKTKEKFSSQANPELLECVKKLAEIEGRQFQSLLEEALTLLLESRKTPKIRSNVLEAYKASLEKNKELLKLLAQIDE